MRTSFLTLVLIAAVGFSACDSKSPTSGGGTGASSTTLKVANTVCPVEDRAAITDDAGYTVDYKGQTIAFCCMKCPPKFKADPEKYMDRMRKDPKHFGYTAP